MSKDRLSRRILCVGMCVLDMIHVCESFPEEDSDRRCLNGYWQRGGNASNICTVLGNLDVNCEFLGMLSESPAFTFLSDDCRQRGIEFHNCPLTKQDPPFSSVILVQGNDSRTIIHSNSDFPILTHEHFSKLDLAQYAWVHFEARNPSETLRMLKAIRDFNDTIKDERERITISVELEKQRVEHLVLAEMADFVFLGKDLAKHLGWHDARTAVFALRTKLEGDRRRKPPSIICTWGAAGSNCLSADAEYHIQKATKPSTIVDPLGAGDVFCAITIYMLHSGNKLKVAAEAANIAAAYKLSSRGYDNLNKTTIKMLTESLIGIGN